VIRLTPDSLHSVCTPLDPGTNFQKDEAALDGGCPKHAELVGCLLYAAMCSWPDMHFAASALARYMSCPMKELVTHVENSASRYMP
jgi:hypothetical protein